MGTGIATSPDQPVELPRTTDVPSQLVSATDSSGIVSGTVSTEPVSLVARDAQRVEDDGASPQMELPLDSARELLTRKQA
jgi:hypothetical protein